MRRHDDVPARACFTAGALLLAGVFGGPAEARCQDAPKARVDWTGCSKPQLMLSKDDLSGAVFTKSEVNRSDFTGADLTGVDMSKAELARVIFSNAKLAGVNFSYANLSRARLSGADRSGVQMGGAHLYQTQLDGADLSRAAGLKQAQLDLACGTKNTKLPQGLNTPKGWPCVEEDD